MLNQFILFFPKWYANVTIQLLVKSVNKRNFILFVNEANAHNI